MKDLKNTKVWIADISLSDKKKIINILFSLKYKFKEVDVGILHNPQDVKFIVINDDNYIIPKKYNKQTFVSISYKEETCDSILQNTDEYIVGGWIKYLKHNNYFKIASTANYKRFVTSTCGFTFKTTYHENPECVWIGMENPEDIMFYKGDIIQRIIPSATLKKDNCYTVFNSSEISVKLEGYNNLYFRSEGFKLVKRASEANYEIGDIIEYLSDKNSNILQKGYHYTIKNIDINEKHSVKIEHKFANLNITLDLLYDKTLFKLIKKSNQINNNLNNQNNERAKESGTTIEVCRPVSTITGGKIIRGESVYCRTKETTITIGHLSNQTITA